MMNTTAVYKNFVKVYFAVSKRDLGSLPCGKHIIGLSSASKTDLERSISDWCQNNGVSRADVDIEDGYVSGTPTDHEVYKRDIPIYHSHY